MLDSASYRNTMQEPIRQSIANAIKWQLAMLEQSPRITEYVPDADLMLSLLEKAVTWEALLDMHLFLKFVRQLINTMTAEGPGANFRRQQEFIVATNAAIQTFAKHGIPTTDLLLAQASYYANIENNGESRRLAIQAAIKASRNTDERLLALLMMSKFLIDSSSYTKARRILHECSSLAAATETGPMLLPDIITTLGMSYFYSDLQAAERYFIEAIEVAGESPQEPAVGTAIATAYHYLGRIKAAQRCWGEALHFMVQERQSADSSRGSEAYYHLRLAEVLLGAGTISEARYHLTQSSRLFALVQQSSTGQVQLDLVLARLELLDGNLLRAEDLFRIAVATAREHSYPRGELQGLAELMRLQLRRISLLAALGTLGRGLLVFLRNEARGGGRHLLTEIRTAAKFTPGSTRRSRSRSGNTVAASVHCRCGADHSQIGQDQQYRP